jgi:hypothetical protein
MVSFRLAGCYPAASRMKEEHARTGDSRRAAAEGLEQTGRLSTDAAANWLPAPLLVNSDVIAVPVEASER